MNRIAGCLMVSACVHALAAWPLVSHAPGQVVAPYKVMHGATRLAVSLAAPPSPTSPAIPFVQPSAPAQATEVPVVAEAPPPSEPAHDSPPLADQGNTHYFALEEVQNHPRPISDFDFDAACLQNKKLRFNVWISAEGRVDQVALVDGTQANIEEGCADSLKHSIAVTRFVPGQRERIDVPTIWYLEVWHDPGSFDVSAQSEQLTQPKL